MDVSNPDYLPPITQGKLQLDDPVCRAWVASIMVQLAKSCHSSGRGRGGCGCTSDWETKPKSICCRKAGLQPVRRLVCWKSMPATDPTRTYKNSARS